MPLSVQLVREKYVCTQLALPIVLFKILLNELFISKSSLLELLLGELPIQCGTSTINGGLSYSSQDSWLFTGTVRANILFDEPYDRKRYNEVIRDLFKPFFFRQLNFLDKVIRSCALETDFNQLPNGDKTIVGDRGASLSGGQQARIK